MPLIFAGVRTALLQLIATAVVAAYAGLGGLGRFLIDGLGQRDIPQVISGSLVVTLLALACEGIFSLINNMLFQSQAAPAITES
jgi:osmoprotectant transport system permease protein